MMYRKLHITGLNKLLALLLALTFLVSVPFGAFGEEAETPPPEKVTAESFSDLIPGKWYYAETAGAIEAGLFQGRGDGTFGVGASIDRSQFITALYRLFGENTAQEASEGEETPAPLTIPEGVTDVSQKAWYYAAVAWAYTNGITEGISPTEFGPLRTITRQEMCKLIGAAIEKMTGTVLPIENAPTYTDGEAIASWSAEWVQKCSVLGLFSGNDKGEFMPTTTATREQAACIFYRYYAGTNSLLNVSGFELVMLEEKDYYLCQAEDFTNCRILGYNGEGSITVSVEQYATYYPYRNTPYVLGEPLQLGHGRAKVTVTVTKEDGTSKDYLIVITDPEAAEYCYGIARLVAPNKPYVEIMAEPYEDAEVLKELYITSITRVYFLGETEGNWCRIQLLYTNTIGYIKKENLQWNWNETEMPAQYADAIAALKEAHPNWTFSFVDMEMTYQQALDKELATYGDNHEALLNPANYLAEDKIFALLDIDSYTKGQYNQEGIKAMWINEKAITKDEAVSYFTQASESLLMNPYYITCRAILESGYGTSKFAKGTVTGYEGYYNFFGIQCYDNNPTVGAKYAKDRNWNSVFRSIVEGANWVKDQYLDQGATTPYFFRYNGFQSKNYMSDAQAPLKEASILKNAYSDPNAAAHFIVPVYGELPIIPPETVYITAEGTTYHLDAACAGEGATEIPFGEIGEKTPCETCANI